MDSSQTLVLLQHILYIIRIMSRFGIYNKFSLRSQSLSSVSVGAMERHPLLLLIIKYEAGVR